MSATLLFPRALSTTAAAATLYLFSCAGMAAAQAHVHVDADDPVRGSTTIITFQVPNEATNSSTTELRVVLPDVASASADVMPGWTVKLDKDVAAGTVRAVTWTATPEAGIPPDQFELFQLLVTLPDADTASFPATQTYADGTVVHWDQKQPAGGAEPEYPAPTLALTAAGAGSADHHMPPPAAPAPSGVPDRPAATTPEEAKLGPDNVARALAGGALLVAAAGVGIALVRRGA